MSRRRRTDLSEDLFEALRWLFSVVHPAWCIPVAVAFFLIPVLWFQHSIKIPQATLLGGALGTIPALVSLASGVAGWKLRQQRAAFLQQHLDIDWLNKSVGRISSGRLPRFIDSAAFRLRKSVGAARMGALTSCFIATARPLSFSVNAGEHSRSA